ncbi:MAG TPA: GtrA family protein, partial [Acidisoma sp.]|nr:GtrA family protein [Acidisoma sp.]
MIARLSPIRPRNWMEECLRFGVVGAVGFVVNVMIVYATSKTIDVYVAGILAWLGAASVTWYLNRVWTFRGHTSARSAYQQWLRFLGANFLGFILYYATYSFLITYSAPCS